MPESVRLIKKYPNRRLYDTKTSAYITLSDVKSLVRSVEAFLILDAKTGDDLTRNVLLQIVLDEEATAPTPFLGSDLLGQLIRWYDHPMQGVLSKHLEASAKSFSDFQRKLVDSRPSHVESDARTQEALWAQLMNYRSADMQVLSAASTHQSEKSARPVSEYAFNEPAKEKSSDK